MRALVIVHDPGSLPGMVGNRLEHHGFELDLLVLTESLDNAHSEVQFPEPTDYDLILPMGAVWSVYDDHVIGSWVQREIKMLQKADELGVPILGICFGGQALAVALGGESVPATEKQVGWYYFESTTDGLAEGPWLEWHYDQIKAPPGAEVVAKDHSCVQAFRIRKNVGTQFHPEVTYEHLKLWLEGEGKSEAEATGVDTDAMLAQTAEVVPQVQHNTNKFVDWFLSEVAEIIPAEAATALHHS